MEYQSMLFYNYDWLCLVFFTDDDDDDDDEGKKLPTVPADRNGWQHMIKRESLLFTPSFSATHFFETTRGKHLDPASPHQLMKRRSQSMANDQPPTCWPGEDSLEETLMLGKCEGKRRRRRQRARWMDSVIETTNMNLTQLWEAVEDRSAWRALLHEVSKSHTQLND